MSKPTAYRITKDVTDSRAQMYKFSQPGDAARKKMAADFIALLKASGVPFIEIWDIDVAHQLISVRLSETEKARYYFRLGYMAVYAYADATLTHLERFRAYRLDPVTKLLLPFDPYVSEMNSIIEMETNEIASIKLGAEPGTKAKVLTLHAVPPFTEGESDTLISQEGIKEASVENPIRFKRRLCSILEINGIVYVLQFRLTQFVHPLVMVRPSGGRVTKKRMLTDDCQICPINSINYKNSGTEFTNPFFKDKLKRGRDTQNFIDEYNKGLEKNYCDGDEEEDPE